MVLGSLNSEEQLPKKLLGCGGLSRHTHTVGSLSRQLSPKPAVPLSGLGCRVERLGPPPSRILSRYIEKSSLSGCQGGPNLATGQSKPDSTPLRESRAVDSYIIDIYIYIHIYIIHIYKHIYIYIHIFLWCRLQNLEVDLLFGYAQGSGTSAIPIYRSRLSHTGLARTSRGPACSKPKNLKLSWPP